MKWFLYLFSVCWITAGAGIILYTDQCRQMLKKMLSGTYDILLGILAIVVGILFIMAAPESRFVWFIVLLGILAIIKGLFLLFRPRPYFQQIISWFRDAASDQTYRLVGIFALLLGAAVLTWIK